MNRRDLSDEGGNRSLSPIVGLILLFGIVIMASAFIFVNGATVIDEVEAQSNLEQTKLSIAQVDQCLSTMVFSGDDSVNCDVSEYDVVDDGTLEVFVNGDRNCATTATLGTLARESDDTVIGYQAGGRFQKTASGSTVISEPQISYTSEMIDGQESMMLDMSLVNVTGTSTGTQVTRGGTTQADFSCLAGQDQYIENVTMYVNDSTFHGAWLRFLEDEFGEDLVDEVDSSSIRVTADLDRERTVGDYVDIDPVIYGGLYSTDTTEMATKDELTVKTIGSGERDQFIVNGDLETFPNTKIDADVIATGSLEHDAIGNPPEATGAVYYGEDDGWPNEVETTQVESLTTDFDALESIDDEVEEAIDHLSESETIDGSTVTAGEYHATDLDLTDVTIDTSDGNVYIGISSGATFDNVSIEGDGQVHVYLDGGEGTFTNGVGGDDADQLWVYASEATSMTVKGSVTGVLYKPGASGGDMDLAAGVDVTGAVVGPAVFGEGDEYTINFDESLRTHTLLDVPNDDSELDVDDGEIDAGEFDNATIRVVDQEVAQDHAVENNSTIRQPLDVSFVLDRSGSMDQSVSERHSNSDWQPVPFTGEFSLSDNIVSGNDDIEIRDDEDTRTVEAGESDQFYADEEFKIKNCGWLCRVTITHRQNDPEGLRVDATKDFISKMNESIGDRAGAIEFNSSANELHELDYELEDVKSSLEANADGGTNMAAGIKYALDNHDYRSKEDANRVIILLSDGENDGYPSKYALDQQTRNQADRAAAQNITIHTIGLGNEIDESLLTEVATKTNGQYHHVENADGLEDIFENVSEAVTDGREYVIENKDVETIVGDTESTDDEWELDPSESISLQVDAYGCDGYDSTGSVIQDDYGTDYEVVNCENRDDDNVTNVDKSTSVHDYGVYTDGDTVPEAGYLGEEKGWWQDDFEAKLEADGLANGGQFDLEPGQAVIVVQFQGASGECDPDEVCEEPYGYAIYLFEGDEDDEVRVNPPGESESGDSASNTYVINIVETEIDVE